LDPDRVLDERNPERQAIHQALVVWADDLRHRHAKDAAVRIANAVGQLF